ncbi:hypothetical protein SDJN02_22545, partial [Cucurbita argyrosperma subsp. argyrosperma]
MATRRGLKDRHPKRRATTNPSRAERIGQRFIEVGFNLAMALKKKKKGERGRGGEINVNQGEEIKPGSINISSSFH